MAAFPPMDVVERFGQYSDLCLVVESRHHRTESFPTPFLIRCMRDRRRRGGGDLDELDYGFGRTAVDVTLLRG
jgi:hypothetical protein